MQMTNGTEKPRAWGKIEESIRYSVAIGCVVAIAFWRSAEPPVLDKKQIQAVQGQYRCIVQGGGKYGSSGPDSVDGVPYYTSFSYLFGIHAPTACFRELDSREVRLEFLPQPKLNRHLFLGIVDIKTRQSYGAGTEKMFALYERQVDSVWPFYAVKLGLLLLALRLTFWQSLTNRVKSN
jgi:hypothetical protein